MSLKCCNVGAQTILDLRFYFPKNKMDECLVFQFIKYHGK